MSSVTRRLINVGVVLFPRALPLDYIGPTTILNSLSKEYVERARVDTHSIVKVTYLAHSLDPLEQTGQLYVKPNLTFAEAQAEGAPKFDVILLPGGAGTRPGEPHDEAKEFLHWAVPRAEWVLTVCTGSWLLASTGLLKGRRATTNKAGFRDVVANTSTDGVVWVTKARWVVDGKFWSAAGVSAGMDMICGWIDEVFGKKVGEISRAYGEYNAAGKDDDPWAAHHELE